MQGRVQTLVSGEYVLRGTITMRADPWRPQDRTRVCERVRAWACAVAQHDSTAGDVWPTGEMGHGGCGVPFAMACGVAHSLRRAHGALADT